MSKVMILGIDGYLGWALALKLGSLGHQVSGVDNYTRRKAVEEVGSHSIVPIHSMEERIKAAKSVLGIDINFREIDILNTQEMKGFLTDIKPDVIVHYGEIPSASYSMIDLDHATKVQHNNVIGTLGLLFLMKEIVPNAVLLKLGTLGEYGSPITGRPLFEGAFHHEATLRWEGREWSLNGEMIPRDPPSIYHISKVQDTINIIKACKWWGLKSYDIMQGIVYGVHTDQVDADPMLRTRFDIDESFGTVVHRFVAQALAGIPLTIYGKGEQIKGFIALDDAMECMLRMVSAPLDKGVYEVVNQVSGLHKLKDVAETVAKVGNEKFGLDVKIQRIENPRVEAEEHPYEVVSRKLPKLGFKPKVSLEEEVTRIFELLSQTEMKRRIEEKKSVILPKVRWDGSTREHKTLEVFDSPNMQKGVHKGVLDRGE